MIIPLCQMASQSFMKKTKPKFTSAEELGTIITQYFDWIEGKYHIIQKETKGILTDEKVWDREPEPATIAGLAFHLGFTSRKQMEQYEANGKYGELIQRARLRVMADYEKKLHVASSSGAIFALKSLGWISEENHQPTEATNLGIKVEIVTSGPPLAASEQEVVL